jgi:hypothetical protein
MMIKQKLSIICGMPRVYNNRNVFNFIVFYGINYCFRQVLFSIFLKYLVCSFLLVLTTLSTSLVYMLNAKICFL